MCVCIFWVAPVVPSELDLEPDHNVTLNSPRFPLSLSAIQPNSSTETVFIQPTAKPHEEELTVH